MSSSTEFLVASTINEVRRLVAGARRRGARIGCVPTMGALHAGHVSLFEVARRSADFIVATIFVNPTQFGPHEDFSRYPRPVNQDLEACRSAGVNLVFLPDVAEVYPGGFSTYVSVEGLSSVLEGAIRPGHFRGVATVVLKLLNTVQPDVAVFGAKDYQQQLLIRRMVRDLALPVELITAPTLRDPDGLAMSSRNAYLSPADRRAAVVLSQSLRLAQDRLARGERDLAAIMAAMEAHVRTAPDAVVDYAVIVDPETLEPLSAPRPVMRALVAARLGGVRLIDNDELRLPGASAGGG